MTDIAAALTDAQKATFEKVKGEIFDWKASIEDHPWMLWKAVESLELPTEKAAKIEGIITEWKTQAKAAKAEDKKAVKAEAAEVYQKVMAELTTEEQAKVKEYRPGPADWYEWANTSAMASIRTKRKVKARASAPATNTAGSRPGVAPIIGAARHGRFRSAQRATAILTSRGVYPLGLQRRVPHPAGGEPNHLPVHASEHEPVPLSALFRGRKVPGQWARSHHQ